MPKVGVRPTNHSAFQIFTQEKLPGRKKHMDIPNNICIFVQISVIVSSVGQ
jgi:hypothetical protein